MHGAIMGKEKKVELDKSADQKKEEITSQQMKIPPRIQNNMPAGSFVVRDGGLEPNLKDEAMKKRANLNKKAEGEDGKN